LPASGISAFGWVYVCGRNFVPAPATGMIAFIFSICQAAQMNRLLSGPADPADPVLV